MVKWARGDFIPAMAGHFGYNLDDKRRVRCMELALNSLKPARIFTYPPYPQWQPTRRLTTAAQNYKGESLANQLIDAYYDQVGRFAG